MSESSGEEGTLQIDVGGPEEVKPPKKKGRELAVWKAGEVVWAKVSGFNFWPAKVLDSEDPIIPVWLKEPPKPTYILVRFFGTYDIQWVSGHTTHSYQNGVKKKFPAKSKSRAFLKAMKETKAFMESGEVPEGLTAPPPDQGGAGGDSSEEPEASAGGRQTARGAKRKSATGAGKSAAEAEPASSKKARLVDNDDQARNDGNSEGSPAKPAEKQDGKEQSKSTVEDPKVASASEEPLNNSS